MGFTYLYKGVSHSVAADHRVLTTSGRYLEDDVTIDVESSAIEDVATTAEMTAKIVAENDGKLFHFTGITDTYINGAYYRIKATTVTPSVTINQKSSTSYGFQNSSALSLDQDLYYGLYESESISAVTNYAVAKITFKNAPNFTLWLNSYARSTYNYSICSTLDAASYPTAYNSGTRLNDTRSFQHNPADGLNTTNFRKVVYENDGGEHFIYVVFRYNSTSSIGANNRKGYYAIEKPQPVTTVIAEEFVQVSGVKTLSNLQTADVKQFASAVVDSTNISAANIKAGVSILGVTGNYSGETPTGKLLITDTAVKDVSSYAQAQVSDADLVAGNIKSGVDILGVVGTYTGSASGKLIIDDTAEKDVTSYASAQVNAEAILAANIRKGVTILGITGTYGVTAVEYNGASLREGNVILGGGYSPSYTISDSMYLGKAGITLVGRGTNYYYDPHYTTMTRWEKTVDFTDHIALIFFAQRTASHGNVEVRIFPVGNRTSPVAGTAATYTGLVIGEWKQYSVNVSALTGNYDLVLYGGYSDESGSYDSATSYAGIELA